VQKVQTPKSVVDVGSQLISISVQQNSTEKKHQQKKQTNKQQNMEKKKKKKAEFNISKAGHAWAYQTTSRSG
jgi:hypothetical protein